MEPGSWAADAEVTPGCVLISIAGAPVTTFAAAQAALAVAADGCTGASPFIELVWRSVPEGLPPANGMLPRAITEAEAVEFPCRMGVYRFKPRTAAEVAAEENAGGYGQVVAAINSETGERVRIKLALEQNQTSEELREVIMQACLQHEYIVPIKDFVFDVIKGAGLPLQPPQIGVVMEILEGGELFAEVVDQGGLPEAAARTYFRHILLAMAYCHGRGLAHRDIKLDSLLLTADRQVCKVCDFGLAKNLTEAAARTIIGTAKYVAPEQLAGVEYDAFKSDIWSCGVCLFCMTECGFPFTRAGKGGVGGPHVHQANAGHLRQMRDLQAARYALKPGRSPEYVAFLERLLCVDVDRRYTAIEALSDPWMLADEYWSAEQVAATQQAAADAAPAVIPGNYDNDEAWMAQVDRLTAGLTSGGPVIEDGF